MAKKQAKFFCENCGEEVAQNARFCNKCGRFFSAVRCPQCGKLSNSVQAKYIKKFQDLPIDGKTVYIKINNRVFNCINNECDLDMFSEQYDFVDFKKNKTKRLFKHILDVSSTTSNRKAEKILKDEGIVVGKSAIALLLAENKSN